MTAEGNSNKRGFIMPGTILDSKGRDPDIDGIDIYVLKVDDLFNKNAFIFLFNEVKGSDRAEFTKEQQ